MLLHLFVAVLCQLGNANLVQVEVKEAVLSSFFKAEFAASKCINNETVAATGI